jgi:hypothetical protein
MTAPGIVKDLVERFEQHRDSYRSGRYNETQVRREAGLDRVRNIQRQIAQVDAEINQRVYALYGLTEEEIKVVEGK